MSFPAGTFVRPKAVPESKEVAVEGVTHKDRIPQPELPVAERIKSYAEVDLVLTEELMEAEAARCLRCGTYCYYTDVEREKHVKGKDVKERITDLVSKSPI